MKKILSVFLITCILILALCGCSDVKKIDAALQEEQWILSTDYYILEYTFDDGNYTIKMYDYAVLEDTVYGTYEIEDDIIRLSESESGGNLKYTFNNGNLVLKTEKGGLELEKYSDFMND